MKRCFAISAILVGSLGMLHPTTSVAQSPAQSGTGYLKTKVNPGRAGVFVDGKYMGPAANFRIGRKYTLPAGEHEIVLSEPRYEEVSRKVTIRAGETTILSERLSRLAPAKPPFGQLRTVDFDKYAAVYVNGKFYGHADEFSNFAQGLLLNPGEYGIRIVPVTGGTAQEEKVMIEADKTATVKAK